MLVEVPVATTVDSNCCAEASFTMLRPRTPGDWAFEMARMALARFTGLAMAGAVEVKPSEKVTESEGREACL